MIKYCLFLGYTLASFLALMVVDAKSAEINITSGLFKNPALQEVIEDFEKLTGHTVKQAELPHFEDSHLKSIKSYLEAKASDIDLYFIKDSWVPILKDHLEDLNKAYEASEKEAFLATLMRAYSFDDRLIAIPIQVDITALLYRKDLFKKHNVDFISANNTWQEIFDKISKIKDLQNSDIKGLSLSGSPKYNLINNVLEVIYAFGGGQLINNSQTVTIKNQSAIKALELLTSSFGKIIPYESLGYSYDDLAENMTDGKTIVAQLPASYLASPKILSLINEGALAASSLPDFSSDFSSYALAISKYSLNYKAAEEFIKYLSGAWSQKLLTLKGDTLPGLSHLYQDQEVKEKSVIYSTLSKGTNVDQKADNWLPLKLLPKLNIETEIQKEKIERIAYSVFFDSFTRQIAPATALEKLQRYLRIILREKE